MILTKRKNRTLSLVFLVGLFFQAQISIAQTYGNEWINYSQQYYKFPIVQEGVYKITYNDLNSVGLPLASISIDQFQIFAREKEIPLKINDGGDNTFDPGDEIWFYGKGNDALLDSLVYTQPELVANPKYSLYNDTINYFLTWTNTGTGLRFANETDINFGSYTPQNYFWKESYTQNISTYVHGPKLAGLSDPTYASGEGWFSGIVNGATGSGYNFNININTPNPYLLGPDAKILATSSSSSNAGFTGSGNHHFQLIALQNNTILKDTIFTGYQLTKIETQIPINDIVNGTTPLRHRIVNDQGATTDQQAIGYFQIDYPHLPNFDNKNFLNFTVPTSFAGTKSRFDVSNYPAGTWNIWTIDNQPSTIASFDNGTNLQFLIPDGTGINNRNVIAFTNASVQNINGIEPINGSGQFTDFSTSLPNNPYLILTHSKLLSSANDYSNYRSSINGGSYNSVVVEVSELYDQFGGGVDKHIIGVRRFLDATINAWNLSPNHVFIIGKSIREASETSATEIGSRKSAVSFEQNLIPSFGYPSSDILIVSGLDGNGIRPGIPIGRLAAQTNAQVDIYLNKMIDFENNQDPNSIYTIADKAWQKHVLHFGGGSSTIEQQSFQNYLNNYKDIIEDTLFGGNVDSYFKTTTQPINPVQSGQVNQHLESGVSIMTFFGHASADGFDQNVDDPTDWNNTGKYPLVIGNACYTGDIHQPSSSSTSEEWVFAEDLGAIGFLSTVKQGFAFTLNLYSTQLYKEIAHNSYGESIGKCIQNTIDVVQHYGSNLENKQAYTSATLGMSLHGDPALRINPHEKPEFVLDASRVFITPNTIDLSVDSLDLNIIVTNIGKATPELIQVEVTREFPNNGGDSTYIQYLEGSYYLDTVVFRLPVYANIGVGINTFKITVDLPSNIEEQYDDNFNNQLDYNYIIDIDGIVPAWPYEYAVLPYDTITVKASTINPLAPLKTYRFEIDTTDLFNSPFKKFKLVTHHGGTLEVNWNEWLNANTGQNQPLILSDSTVVFWRVAKDSTTPTWFESSFQYINNKWGWGQDHFFQRKNNDFIGQIYDRTSRDTYFGDNYKKFTCEVFGNGSNLYEWNGTLYRLNGEIQDYSLCGLTPSIHVVVIDPLSLEPWETFYNGENPTHQFGNFNNNGACRSRTESYFIFRQNDATQLQALDNMLQNDIPDSSYVLIYSTLYGQFDNWQTLHPNLFNTLNSLGSTLINPGDQNVPFIIMTKKGLPTSTTEIKGQTIDDYIELTDTIHGVDYIGLEKSTIIGPAFSWDKLYWQSYSDDPSATDSVRIKLYGIENNNNQKLVLDTVLTITDSLDNLNTWLPPLTYPRLGLEIYHHDSLNFTPRQLDSWHVLYDPVPEAAYWDAATLYKTFSDTIYEGEEVALAIDIRNISQFPMDSLKVDYWIEDHNRVRHNLDYPRQDSLQINELLRDTIRFNSRFFPGLNSLWIEVNPYITTNEKDQPEQYHFNNIAQIPFYVSTDNENPILDVTFDGERILNGDLVAPSPQILISLKDENPYLIMDDILDTALFDIDLVTPAGELKNIYFSGGFDYKIDYEFANSNNKKFKVYYKPSQLTDGKYKLKVQGKDKSENVSGDYYYEIEFEVVNRSTITRLMNYPNPFSTQTRFVFTLTGNKVPDYMNIQIMTITGKVVREITTHELGPIRIGRNITSYAWDGRDEYGDLLANGIYLYRVIAEIDGEAIELRNSGADEYFKKDFGKMVLFR